MSDALKCLNAWCGGEVKGEWSRHHQGWRYYEDEQYECSKCSTFFGVHVTDDFEDDAVASLVELPGDEATRTRLTEGETP